MTLWAALLLANHGLVSGHVEYRVDAKELTRGGDTYTPDLGIPPNQYGVTFIIMPAAQVTATFIKHQNLLMRYSPQIMLQVPGVDVAGPQVLHHVNAAYGIGDAEVLRLNTTGAVMVGSIDGATGGQLLSAFGGLLGPTATGQTSDYLGLTLTVGLEKSWSKQWDLKSNWSINKLESTGGSSSTAFDQVSTVSPTVEQLAFQDQLSVYSKNELAYVLVPEKHTLMGYLQLSDVSFPLTSTFFGVMPQVGYIGSYQNGSKLNVKAGAFLWMQNPYPGDFIRGRTFPAIDITFEHGFQSQGVTRLRGRFNLGIAPYYDLFFGELRPRTQLMVDLTYALTHEWEALLGIRAYAADYWTFHEWVPILPGRTKEIVIVNAGLKYKYAKWLEIDGGLYADQHWYHASLNQPYPFIRELYVTLGATGTWQVN